MPGLNVPESPSDLSVCVQELRRRDCLQIPSVSATPDSSPVDDAGGLASAWTAPLFSDPQRSLNRSQACSWLVLYGVGAYCGGPGSR